MTGEKRNAYQLPQLLTKTTPQIEKRLSILDPLENFLVVGCSRDTEVKESKGPNTGVGELQIHTHVNIRCTYHQQGDW